MALLDIKDLSHIEEKVLPKIRPTESELLKIKKLTDEFIYYLKKFAQQIDLKYVFIEPQGSTGKKQTNLTKASDIDIFFGLPKEEYKDVLKLEKKARKEKLKEIFLEIINKLFIPVANKIGCEKVGIFYAEHPYLITKKGIYDIDLVGCFSMSKEELLKNGPITAVDRTPVHTQIINENLTKDQKDEVRLLKAFFQACYAYGDKCAVGQFGFTGFSAEVIILYFSSLYKTFQNFSSLLKKPIDFFNRDPKVLLRKQRFQNDYFIIIDPTDPERNIAASISKRAYDYVNFKITKFLESPSGDFFDTKPIKILSTKELSKIGDNTYILEFQSNGTVHYTELRDKLYSLGNKLKIKLEKEESGETKFGKCIFSVYSEDNFYILPIYCSLNNLSDIYQRQGPPLYLKEHVDKFKEKNKNTYIKNGFIWTECKRQYVNFSQLISDFIKKIKIEGLNLVNQSSTGIHLAGKKALTVLYKIILSLNE